MALFGKILMWWGVLSVPTALFWGAFIRVGMGSGEPTAAEKQVVFDAIDAWRA